MAATVRLLPVRIIPVLRALIDVVAEKDDLALAVRAAPTLRALIDRAGPVHAATRALIIIGARRRV